MNNSFNAIENANIGDTLMVTDESLNFIWRYELIAKFKYYKRVFFVGLKRNGKGVACVRVFKIKGFGKNNGNMDEDSEGYFILHCIKRKTNENPHL